MNITRIEVNHGSDEWFDARISLLSSSRCGDLIGKDGNETSEKYILTKVHETLSNKRADNIKATSLDWGTEYEPYALQAFSERTGETVLTGMAYEWDGVFWGTPDGETSEPAIIEVKCPINGAVHIQNLTIKDVAVFKKKRKDYYWQILGNILLSGYEKGYFVSYDSRLKQPFNLSILEVKPIGDDLETLKSAIEKAHEIKMNTILSLV